MIFAQHIKKENGIHYYYQVVDDKIRVFSFDGPDSLMKAKMDQIHCTMMLILFEEFLLEDEKIQDSGKIFSYTEIRKRCHDFLIWGHENKDISARRVIENGYKARKFMQAMIEMISDTNPFKKNLIFFEYNVTQLYLCTYNIEE